MSFFVVDRVLKESRCSGSAQLVLVHLASFANHDGTSCHPTMATLVERTGLSERTVRTCVLWLASERIGEILLTKRGRRYHYELPRYRQELPVSGVSVAESAGGTAAKFAAHSVTRTQLPLRGTQ